MITLEEVKNINYDEARRRITRFIEEKVSEAGARGAVIGLSGGIDSSVVFKLALEALGNRRITALVLPDSHTTPEDDVKDALRLAEEAGVEKHLIWIDKIIDSYSVIPFFDINSRIPTGNLRARIRMTILYYYANKNQYIVLGTGDRSEILIGYYTKYGDGAVDALPIGALYKTQVREIGKHIHLPRKIIEKPSSPRLWPGHMAEEELGMKYEEIDKVLYALFDKHIPVEKIPAETGVEPVKIQRIIRLHCSTRHKRHPPPIPSLPWAAEPIMEIKELC